LIPFCRGIQRRGCGTLSRTWRESRDALLLNRPTWRTDCSIASRPLRRRSKHCPGCHHASHSLHSRYWRVLRDLPWHASQRYRTILVDRERHKPVDLLPDRSADSLEGRLPSHLRQQAGPGRRTAAIRVCTRGRSRTACEKLQEPASRMNFEYIM
jgi:hypothetical protein